MNRQASKKIIKENVICFSKLFPSRCIIKKKSFKNAKKLSKIYRRI